MVEKFAPGSFTKNYGWNTSPPGLQKLHSNIRRGFTGQALPVTREDYRARHGPGPDLVAVNFFLHNTILGGTNYITADELVRQALTAGHSRSFDQLALFALHLGRTGKRTGHNTGDEYGAAFANDYVRHRLWQGEGWAKSATTIEAIKSRFNDVVIVTGRGDAGKSATNYHFMLEQAGLTSQQTELLNSRWPDWVGSAAFLLFDRVNIDHLAGALPNPEKLVAAAKAAEFHKLVGGPEVEVFATITLLARAYCEAGGLQRPWAGVSTGHTAGIPVGVAVTAEPSGHVKWSDEAALEVDYVERRKREVEAQLRKPKNVSELKALYDNRCLFCERQIVVGVDPVRFYSEAAHIKPLGKPHNGPDQKNNMILLCPEHHLQFDRGILRIESVGIGFIVKSRVPGDPIDGKTLNVVTPHTLDQSHIDWHLAFWKP
jgi:hypothetical protein